jgi:CcmD family protein
MTDFFAVNQLYIVLAVVLLVWGGIVVYLFRLDRKLSQLETKMRKD